MIRIAGLEVTYGAHRAVEDLTLEVPRGTLYALLGGNGAGKTSTLHAVLGLLTASKGLIEVDGQRIAPGQRPRAVFVPEVVDLYPDLDALETLELFAAVAGRKLTFEARAAALSRAGLDPEHHRRRLRGFSKGMRQKVALALSDVHDARTLVLDEPTSGLDPAASDQLAARLREAKAEGASILMSTHDVLHAAGLADRVGILMNGRLVRELDAADLDAAGLLAVYREAVAPQPA